MSGWTMFATNNPTNSVLGKKYDGLRRSASTTYNGPNLNETAVLPENGPPPIISAPLDPADIPRILEVLAPCPTGPYALRVFQQHPEGLCWQDSLFIMLYNQDWFRPFLMETIQVYLDEFLRHGHTNLTYAGKKTVTQKNYSNAVPLGTPYKNRPNVSVEIKNLPVKIIPIAATFATRYAGIGLPLKFWEYYALQLHRYILLAYLFIKYPDTATVSKPMPKSTILHSRRKSISAKNYGELALNFKEYVFRMLDTGMYCENFKKGRRWFEILVKAISRNTVFLIEYTTPGILPENILGYYSIIHSSISIAKHIISLFKCNGQWILYDIDVGVVEFSPENSALLDRSKMANLLIENNIEKGVFEYRVTLEDGTIVRSDLPSQVSYKYKLDKFIEYGSLMLVRDVSAPVADKKTAGGRYRSKTRKRNTRKNRRTK